MSWLPPAPLPLKQVYLRPLWNNIPWKKTPFWSYICAPKKNWEFPITHAGFHISKLLKFKLGFSCLTSRASSLWRSKISRVIARPVVAVVVVSPIRKPFEKTKNKTNDITRKTEWLCLAEHHYFWERYLSLPLPSRQRDAPRRPTWWASSTGSYLLCYTFAVVVIQRLGYRTRGYMHGIPDRWQETPQHMHSRAHKVRLGYSWQPWMPHISPLVCHSRVSSDPVQDWGCGGDGRNHMVRCFFFVHSYNTTTDGTWALACQWYGLLEISRKKVLTWTDLESCGNF